MPATTAKRVTAADVARSLGLSRATVGFVLNDTPGQKISDATRERVIAEAKRLGYRANSAARALASGHSRIVLLVMPDWPLDHNLRTNLDEASLALDEAGYSLVTMTTHAGGKAQPLWETLNPDVVMGLTPFTRDQIAGFRAAGVEHIVPDAALEDGSVLDELSDGPVLQVRHLIGRGRARLAYAGAADPRLIDLTELRHHAAASEVAVSPGVELVASVEVDAVNAAERLGELLAAGVDGVIAYNDDVAAWLLGAALRSGVEVPGRLAIVGHDDTPIASLLVPSLSTVRVDIAGLGRYFAQMALTAAAGAPVPADRPRARVELIARETT
ncbi:LacI family DNA-binding transcriptional regulator [Microbacterium hominis]|uniref:LacI family DNA-binding transcriptional regulator n=1 Tax=Microbacterium hominis TaxID=162426 RepID=A0A7D4UK97_9MICO|nr:LacI family DNA-binding transcriptional regulator [Microbacterium hominis]QKJ20507.1 LacI family DNA-binding transcriptional regulator [Microbacterium hominis]